MAQPTPSMARIRCNDGHIDARVSTLVHSSSVIAGILTDMDPSKPLEISLDGAFSLKTVSLFIILAENVRYGVGNGVFMEGCCLWDEHEASTIADVIRFACKYDAYGVLQSITPSH